MHEKNLSYGALLDYYSSLLTERQRDLLDFYYNEDLSLSEIAENTGISRQGVRDAIKHGEAELDRLESALGAATSHIAVRSAADSISRDLLALRDETDINVIIGKITDIAARVAALPDK